MIGHYRPQNHAPACARAPRGTKGGGCRVWMALPFPFAAATLLHFPTAVSAIHLELYGSPALPVPAVVQSHSCTVRSWGRWARRFQHRLQAAEESSRRPSRPSCCLLFKLHPCSGRAVWPLLHEADRYSWSHRDWETSDLTTARKAVSRGSLGCVMTASPSPYDFYQSSELIPSAQRLPKSLLGYS